MEHWIFESNAYFYANHSQGEKKTEAQQLFFLPQPRATVEQGLNGLDIHSYGLHVYTNRAKSLSPRAIWEKGRIKLRGRPSYCDDKRKRRYLCFSMFCD